MAFSILLDSRALGDIQDAVDYYEDKEPGLGIRFENELNESFMTLIENPHFQIRYDNIRCLPMKNFPYMIHYTVNDEEKGIIVRSLLSTYRNPGNWGKR
jgi:toxin ParE1/3/4